MKKKILILAMILPALGACTKSQTTPPDPVANKSLTLVSYNSCAELENEVKEMLIGHMEKTLDSFKDYCHHGPFVPTATPDVSSGEKEGATSTNLAEEGVDEADLIKNDGRYVYAVVQGDIMIAQVWPFSDFKAIASIRPQGTPSGIFLSDGKLIVITNSNSYGSIGDPADCASPGSPPSKCVLPPAPEPVTAEEVYDVSDPSNPVLLKRKTFAADLLDTRRVGDRLYLVLSNEGVIQPDFDYGLGINYEDLPSCSESGHKSQPTDEFLVEIENLKEKNRKLAESLTLSQLMPAVGGGKEIGCTDVMRSESATGTELLMIVSDQYADPAAASSKTALLSNGGTVYASKKALYISAAEMPFRWWDWLDYSADFEDRTVIHRFAIDAGVPSYTSSGEVDGHLLDDRFAGSRYSTRFSMAQFAMSEREGYLRVATTQANYTEKEGATIDNRVLVLDAPSLAKVGEVGGMGEGEKIHAVRFIGDKGYVVTFKKTDPLYVVDLADPKSPQVAGELKVPGFSTYIHPLDDTHLIGLGFGADDTGAFAWTQGLKVALFDVTDPANPAEAGSREIGSRGSYSAAVEEHHAFTLDRERGLIALPVDVYDGGTGGDDFGTHSFSGVMVLRADLSGSFDTVGNIIVDSSSGEERTWWGRPSTDVLRTIVIGDGKTDGIVTLTSSNILVNRIDETMTSVGEI